MKHEKDSGTYRAATVEDFDLSPYVGRVRIFWDGVKEKKSLELGGVNLSGGIASG